MGSNNAVRLGLATIVAFTATLWTACNNANTGATSPAAAGGGKVPVTTVSAEARKEFLEGRDLSEKLLAQDSLQHFDKALALDPDFASAELARANNSPTAKEFFEHLNKAVGLADKASDGEKLFILANQAGANGDVPKQKDLLDKLVAAYPNDERAQFALGQLLFWPAGIRSRRRALQKGYGTGSKLFALPITFSAMPTGNRVTTPTPSRPSRNTSN